MGMKAIFGSGSQILFGGGLRFASPENIGFYTESSYITILIESGILLGSAFIGTLFFYTSKMFLLSRGAGGEGTYLYVALFVIFAFVLIESVFNRYLLAIGNPMSLFFLFICVSVGLSRNIFQLKRG
jgi:hypothetical protein